MATVRRLFDRVTMSFLEKWTETDHNEGQEIAHETILQVAGELLGLGGAAMATEIEPALPTPPLRVLRGLRVESTGGMALQVTNGLGFTWLTGGGGTGLQRTRPLYLNQDISPINLSAADPGLDRIDRIVIFPRIYNADSDLRDVKPALNGPYVPTAVWKRLRSLLRFGSAADVAAGDAEVYVKEGTPAAVPVAPALGAWEVSLGTIYVQAAAVAVTQGEITDERVGVRLVSEPRFTGLVIGSLAGGYNAAALADKLQCVRRTGGLTFTSVTRNGQGDYTLLLGGAFDPLGGGTAIKPLIQVTPYGAAVVARVEATAAVNGGPPFLGDVIVPITLWDLAGNPADADFCLDVQLRTTQGGALY